ncbi:MAG: hypothetical protein QOF66_6907 [Mycobacterium sp.]|nr:hypothetical protein [Mycobacterium sp.]
MSKIICRRARGQERRLGEWLNTTVALTLAAVAVAIAAFVGTQVSTGQGYTPWQDRASSLVRRVGLGSVLDYVENWFYSVNGPGNTQPDLQTLGAGLSGRLVPRSTAQPFRLPALPSTSGIAGWRELGGLPGAKASVFTAFVQPDRVHRGVVVAVALMRSSLLQAHLVAGTVQPIRSGSPAKIATVDSPNLVTAFNSGFKMSAHPGGFYLNGKTMVPLVDGKASAVIDDTGRLTVGQWGRDVQMSSHVTAVRQNLALVVEHGQAVRGLNRNVDNRWGSPRNQFQYTWRSGLGLTAHGDVVYVAGDKLNLTTLATAMVDVGVTTGMELDIHSGQQSFTAFTADPSGEHQPHKLMTTMSGPVDRYVSPDARDFFYFTRGTIPAN